MDSDEILEESMNDDNLSISNDNYVLSANEKSYEDLNNAINKLSPGITLTLSSDYAHNGKLGHIEITKDVSINGNGHYISGKKSASVFKIVEDDVTLTLKNLIFKEGLSDNGGIIHTKNNVNINIINCTFIDNEALEDGGAIYFDSKGTLDIRDSSFIKCFTRITDEASVKHNGGAINTHDGVIKIDNCIFRNNTAGFGYGGVIFLHGECSGITNSIFENNLVRSRFGGCVYVETNNRNGIVIDNCSFTNNTSLVVDKKSGGGAAFYYDGKGLLRITNSNFTRNMILGEPSDRKTKYESTRALFDSDGGAIYSGHDIEIGNCRFIYNHALDHGGAVYAGEGIRWIGEPSIFINNSAGHANSHFANKGGAIYAAKFLNDAKGLVFINNTCWYGGAIYINNKNEVTFDSCVFRGNYAFNYDGKSAPGSAVYIDSSSSKIHLINNVIVDNYGNEDRGFYNCGKYGTIEHNWFGSNNPNFADAYLVEWHRFGSNDKKSDSNYLKLAITSDTNSVYESNATLTAYFVDYKGNNFTGKLNGLDVSFFSDGAFDEFSQLKNGDNKATVVFIPKEPITVHKVSAEFDYQTVSTNINQKGNFTWLQEQINAANGVYNLNRDLSYSVGIDKIVDGIFIGKEITINGNGHTLNAWGSTRIFDVHWSNVKINNITFVNGREIKDGGGAIFIDGVENVTVSNSIFKNNFAERYGGAIYARNGNHIEILNSEFTNNHENSYGGGAVLLSSPNSLIKDCKFTSNDATQGGALDLRADSITVDGCEFRNNRIWDTNNGGSAINSFGNNLAVLNSLFLNNKGEARYFDYISKDNKLIFTMTGYNDYINAISSDSDVKFSNVTYWDGKVTTSNNPPHTENESGINFTLEIFDSQGRAVKNVTITSNSTGQAVFDCSVLPQGNYTFRISHADDNYYTATASDGEFNVTRPSVYPSSVKINMKNKQEFALDNCKISFDVVNRTDVGILITNAEHTHVYYSELTNSTEVTLKLPANENYYSIIVENIGNDTYEPSSDTKLFKINPDKSRIVLNPIDDIIYGDNLKVTFKGDGDSYNVTVYDKNKKSVFSKITPEQVMYVPSLNVGNYTVVVTNLGNENKTQSNNSTTFNVWKADNNFKVIVDDSVYDKDVNIVVEADVDGKYSVDINSTIVNVIVKNGVGNASLSLNAGNYHADVSFKNANYNNKAIDTTFTVEKSQSNVYFGLENITINQEHIISYSDDFPTQYNITIYDQGNNVVFNNITDEDHFTLPDLDVGQYNLTVVNLGNENILGSQHSRVFEVTSDNYVAIRVEDSVYGRILPIVIGADVDGFYTVDINGTELTIEVIDGIGYNDTLELPAGDYYANVSFDNPDYNNIIENTIFTVYMAESNVEIMGIENITYGEDVYLEYYDDYNATFTIVIFDENDDVIWEFRTNATSTIISDLAAGNYTLMVTNEGDENIIGISEFKNFTVYRATPKMKVTAEGNEINVELPEDATGEVSTVINGKEESYPVVDGIAIIPLYHLKPGNYSFNVKYSGDKNYTGASGKTKTEISKITPEMTVKANKKEITVQLPDDATGSVKTTVNGKEITAAVSKGKAVILLGDLNPGNYTFDVRYLGNDKYYPRSEKTSLNIPKIDPQMNASFEVNEIVVELPEDATGNVTTSINGIQHSSPVVDGLAIIPLYDVKPGNYTLNIKYSGDDKYLEDNAKIKAELYKVTPEMTVSAKNNVINVVLPDDATGNVTVNVDGKEFTAPVKNGKATITVTGLEPGKYTANVKYSGNDYYYPRSEKTSVTIPKIDPNMNASFEENEIIVELPEDATGNVSTTINGVDYTSPVVDGLAIIPLYDLKPGNYTFDIKYTGDEKYLEDNAKVDAVLDKVTPEMTVSTKDNVINVALPDDATGNVTVNVDGKDFTAPVKNGKATITVSGLEPGKYSANVKYSGNDYYYPKNEKTDVSIPKIAPEMKVHKNNDNIIVELPEDATGNVVLEVAGEKLTAPVENGKAEFSLDKVPSGEYDAKITYSGDDKYKSAKASEKISIDGIELVADDVVKYFSGSERLVVTLLNNDKPVKSKEINITLHGVTYSRITDDNGQVSLGINLVSGNYTAFVETEEYSISTLVDIEVKSTVYSNDLVKMFRNATQFNALFLDSKGNPLANTDVIFNIHGVFYTRTTNATGWAKLNINLEEGKYYITSMNTVTGEGKCSTVTVLSLLESSDLTKYYKNDSQFVVRVHSDDGGWAKEGEEVLFNINGVFYVRITNETGHVKLNINLNPGEYIVTADCKGCYKSNSILVLPTLTAEDLNMKYKDGSKFTAKVVDGQGKPYPNQNVTFNVNGVFYTRTTDANGEAKLNINLMAGEYIITSGYNGAYTANKITISS